jgi:hypothetical protein
LCDRCAKKWSYGHKCASTVQLHVMQELWELMSKDNFVAEDSSAADSTESGQLCLFLSEAASTGVDSPKSLRLMGQIQGHDIMILIDSGSSHTFVSNFVAARLSGLSSLTNLLSVQVANGSRLTSSIQLQDVVWEVQGYKFCSDLKVIPL